MSVWEKVNDQRLDPQDPHDVAHTGLWGTISQIIGSTVTVACDDFDGGTHDFGPVPYMGATPSIDERAFVHFDSLTRPAYAVVPEVIATGGGGGGGVSNVFIQHTAPTGVTDPYVWFETNLDGSLRTIWTGP